MRKKGPTKAKMKEVDPEKKFCSANIKKVPRAYESFNPALYTPQMFMHMCTYNTDIKVKLSLSISNKK
jgi:hypothetical protein